MNDSFVLKIGGSVMYDDLLNINLDLFRKVKDWYYESKSNYNKIAMVVGGGSLSRDLQKKIAFSVGGQEYLHNIGMSVTQTNATIVQGYMGDNEIYVPKKLGDAYEFLWEKGKGSLVSGGLKVGWSTDMDAAVFADILNVDRVYKLSNIEYIYKEDPKINPNAEIIKDLTWDEYLDQFGVTEDSVHVANTNVPIDFECARFCSKKNISFFISGGKFLNERETIKEILTEGTLIHP